ncbi:hypothetical protein C2G38_2112655 [Gigaspora rosea]|uniref:Uncharacterized protein n=1 Tax=Gigaspora rosea TaxID=44941 RepID=A0A397UKC7_9GLOM|nr:hypothetical protein C2G38_2112655 [Gigaspora rosea]
MDLVLLAAGILPLSVVHSFYCLQNFIILKLLYCRCWCNALVCWFRVISCCLVWIVVYKAMCRS